MDMFSKHVLTSNVQCVCLCVCVCVCVCVSERERERLTCFCVKVCCSQGCVSQCCGSMSRLDLTYLEQRHPAGRTNTHTQHNTQPQHSHQTASHSNTTL